MTKPIKQSAAEAIEELTQSLKKGKSTPEAPALEQEGVKTGGNEANAGSTANLVETQSKTPNKPWQFQPGKSGNPKGPKPGYHHAKTYFMKILKEMAKTSEGKSMEIGEAMARAQVKVALAGDTRAFNAVFDRVDGKAPQPLIGDAEEDAIRVDVTTGMKSILGKAYGENNGGQ